MRIKRRLSRTGTQSQNLQESMDGIEVSLGTLFRYLLAKGTLLSGAVTPVHKIKVREHFVPSSSFLYAVPDRLYNSFTQYITVKTGYFGSIRPLVICCDTLVMSLLNFVLLRFINFALLSKLSYATTSESSFHF